MEQVVLCAITILMIAPSNLLSQHATLYTWYSETRGDHFTTTDPAYAGEVGARRPDGGGSGYELIRVEGDVFAPDFPQPPGTVPLYSFWHGGRTDNFLTSDPRWTGSEARDGYRRFRLEGYVFARPLAGTRPLTSYWSGSRTDNYATTDPRLALSLRLPAGARTPTVRGRGYQSYRVEGYVIPTASEDGETSRAHVANLGSIGFGAWRPLRPEERGTRPDDPLARARPSFTTPMIVAPVEFADMRFSTADLDRYRAFASPTGDLSLERAIRATSRGKFAWQARLIPKVSDPLTFARITNADALRAVRDGEADAFRAEAGYGLDVYDVDGDGTGFDDIYVRSRVLKLIDRHVAFDDYDANRDGRIDASELVVLRFGADGNIGGQQGGSGAFWLDDEPIRVGAVRLDGVDVDTSVLLVAKNTTRAGLVHEMLHTWGGTDIYGPCYGCHNQQASLMAAMIRDDRFYELDPWHKQKFGWVRPVFVPISETARPAGGVRIFASAAISGMAPERSRPVVFYDPTRGLREYYVAEFRTPFPPCPDSSLPGGTCPGHSDNGVADVGIAVWHVVTNDRHALNVVTRGGDPSGRFLWRESDGPEARTVSMGVIDPTTGVIGRPRFLKPGDGEMTLRWMNGSDTGLRLSAGGITRTSNAAILQWRDASSPLALRLDRLRVPGFPREEWPRVPAGTTVAVDGVFGARAGVGAALVAADGRTRTVDVTSWGPSRMILRIRPDTPAGRYRLVTGPAGRLTGGDDAGRSNGLRLEVPPPALAQPVRPLDRGVLRAPVAVPALDPERLSLALEAEAVAAERLEAPGPVEAVPTDVYPGAVPGLEIDPDRLRAIREGQVAPLPQIRPDLRVMPRKN